MAGLWAVNAMACTSSIASLFGPARQAIPWPAYLGNTRHDASAAESLSPDPRPLWHTAVGRAIRGGPALGESIVAVGLAERYLVLLDRTTGQVLWRSRVHGTIHGGPLLHDDRLYVATQTNPEGRVYAIRLKDGRILWKTTVGSVEAPLGFDGEALFAATEEGVVLRLDPARGTVAWRRPVSGAVRAAPVPTIEGLVVATTNDTLYLLDQATGEIRARRHTPGTVLGGPAVDGRRLFLATTAGRVLEVELPSLSVRWERPAGDAVFGAPALAGDTLYTLSRDGTLWIIPIESPDAARSFPLGIVATAGPTPLATGVLVAGVNGAVLLIDRATGAVRWRTHVDGPIEQPPLVRDRQLVVIDGRGDIHSYR